MKYLAIKNWDTFQPARRSAEWIKDYTNQSDDEDLGSLSFFEQGVLQALRRARGRSGKNIHNDFAHIASATHARVTDRPHLRHALDTLIARGILVPTNEQHNSLEERRGEEKRGDKSAIKADDPHTKKTDPEHKRENEIIELAFEHYCISTERNRLTYRLTPQRRKVALARLRECLKLTHGDYDKAAGLLGVAIDKLAESSWHMGRDPGTNGKRYCDWSDHLFKSYERMEKWWNA